MKYNEDDREALREKQEAEREEDNLRAISRKTRQRMAAAKALGFKTDLQLERAEEAP